ncbi:deoxyribose-phosphate aldolase [Psychroflexus sp. ALD_RP9]|uniref:deoxyribose-phosphate aldolase n=1 Tax=Psychroflexus sp. ALD_RP9 TaxID=2777186 RepID=UPI001A8E6D03|nr:deoxyribose-phosphate aldolase [Psychroflexus sp. ALD_RP9]QSS97297.1 deoxyribose-phosphate aldolase [Psychroflexus sp. ALD_RP9]
MPINQFIDHTALKATTSISDIKQLCEEAKAYHFASVCINPCFVELATELLSNSDVKICTVIGFPLGNTTTKAKVEEARQALKDGATEFDMVINQSFLKSGELDRVKEDISEVKKAVGNNTLKVILEICNLTDEEIKIASVISEKAGANYVKTSTGFGSGGATVEAIKIMKASVSNQVKLKASGGIRDAKTAQMFIDLGVHRLGASSGVAIMNGLTSKDDY